MDFGARKQAVLQALAAEQRDKSRKGGVDAPIAGLIERINKHPYFFTTSSCSGRVCLYLAVDDAGAQKRKGGQWIYVSHEPADAEQVVDAVREKYLRCGLQGLLVFKYEPFILALECSSAGAGQQLVACAIASGFRESGITSLGKRVIVAVRCSIRLEVPIAKAGQLLVPEEYLRVLTTMANEKMEINCNRTDKFMSMFIDQVEDRLMNPDATALAAEVCSNGTENENGNSGLCGPGSGTEEGCLDGREDGDEGSLVPSREARNGFVRTFSSSRNDLVFSEKEFELRQRTLLHLENRQIRLMSRMQTFETMLSTLGFIPRAEISTTWDICRDIVKASPSQGERAGSKCDAGPPSGCNASEVAAGNRCFQSSCKAPLEMSGSDVVTTTQPAATGFAISNGCSLLAASLVVSGEPVEKLHRWSHSACAVSRSRKSTSGAVIIFGGYGGLGRHARLNDVLLLDLDTGYLHAIVADGGPSARQAHSCVVIEDKMVVIGGREGPRKPLDDVHVFSIPGESWSSIATSGASFPPRHRHAAVAIGPHIYVFGGISGSEIYNDLHVLDTDIMHWTRLSCHGELPCPRHSHSMATMGERIYLFGGRDEQNIHGDLYVLETGLLQWTRVGTTGKSPVPRFSHSMAICGGFLVVLGGCPITKTSREIHMLHLELLTWRSVTLCLPSNSLPVRHSVCAVKNKLLVFGGGAACFAFGSAFNSPFVLDMDKILLAGMSENGGSSGKGNECLQQTFRDFPKAEQGLGRLPLSSSELIGAPIKDGSPATAEFAYVLEKSVAKQGKDILKKLAWLDLTRKAKILSEGKSIAFPVTAAAVPHLAGYQERQGLVANTNFSLGQERMVSTLRSLNGGMSRTSLPGDSRRLNTVQRSLQQEISTLLHQRCLSTSLLSEVPRRWERLGDMAVLPASSFTGPIWDALGTDLWISLARALGVTCLARQAAVAANGTRDSRLELLLGTNGWVEHRENGILYCFDATKCMFSSGNVSEKLRMATMLCFGETVVDLFAGIGYYVLPFLLKAGAKHVYACEWNPNALDALRHNLKVNLVADRCTIIEGDNRVMAPQRVANRVCLGLLPTSEGSWDAAVRALRREGGMLHVHANVKDTEQEQWVAYMLQSFTSLACSQGLQWQISVSHVERVKWYAPHIRHIVVDVLCSSP